MILGPVRRFYTLAAAATLTLFVADRAAADAWALTPRVVAETSYDSNPRMLEEDAQESVGAAVIVELPFSFTHEVSTVELTPRLRQADSHGDPSLLSNFRYLDARWRAIGERNTLEATASVGRDTTLFDDLETAAGLGTTQNRNRQLAGLVWDRALSERTDLSLGANWTRVTYDRAGLTERDNYRYLSGDASYTWKLTSRTAVLAIAGAGRYQTGDSGYVSDTLQGQLGLICQLTEKWSLTGIFGVSEVRNRIANPSGEIVASNQGTVFSFDARRTGQRLQLALSASRSVQPTGLGILATQDQGAARVDYALTERLGVGAGVDITRIEDALGNDSIGDRRFRRANLGVNWRWRPELVLGVQAVHSERRQLPIDERASGSGVYFSLTRAFGRVALH